MSRSKSTVVIVVMALISVLSTQSLPAGAQQALTPQPTVQLVGDSLSHAAEGAFPADWQVRARNGRALFESMPILSRATARHPACVVVALGSNDVGQQRSASQMAHDLDRADQLLADFDCVYWTTVKVHNVTPLYGRNWAQYATTWNGLLTDRVHGRVLDWNAVARSHPGYFLGDGLHMTGAGRVAFANFLTRAVAAT